MRRDYESNPELDNYSVGDIDDRSSIQEMTRAERLQAEAAMRRRDLNLPGGRASRRGRVPAFLESDDDVEVEGEGDGLLRGIDTRRRRRQYDERMDEDDAGEEEVGTGIISRQSIEDEADV